MSIRASVLVLCAGATAFAMACGGGGGTKEEAPPPTTAAAAPAAPAGNGTIAGKILFEGTPPAPEKLKVTADAKCQAKHPNGLERQTIAVKDGGLADVFVYVKSGVTGSYPPPTDSVLLDQEGCMYHPYMVTVRAGQPIKIRNSDDTMHNIHPRPTVNKEFNEGQARKGMEKLQTFDKPEVMIPVGCDVHPWMRSYISVLDHPFFTVSKEDGTYEIKGLPAGDYEVEAYHGKLKTQTQKISVKDGETAKLDFTYKG
jgi:plastocyanin